MATAVLTKSTVLPDARTVWRVSADPFHASPFDGQCAKDWQNLKLIDSSTLQWEWRTRADIVRESARRINDYDDLIIELDEVLQDYLRGRVGRGDDEEWEPSDDDVEWLRFIASGENDPASPESPFAAYSVGSTQAVADALSVLPRPEWAGVFEGPEGIVLIMDAGKGLDDLVEAVHAIDTAVLKAPEPVADPSIGDEQDETDEWAQIPFGPNPYRFPFRPSRLLPNCSRESLRSLAAADSAEAIHDLAVLILLGAHKAEEYRGSLKEAVDMLAPVARRGHAPSQYAVGYVCMTEPGFISVRDAVAWFQDAAHTYASAREALAWIQENIR